LPPPEFLYNISQAVQSLTNKLCTQGASARPLWGDLGKEGFGKRGIREKGDLAQNELGALTPKLGAP